MSYRDDVENMRFNKIVRDLGFHPMALRYDDTMSFSLWVNQTYNEIGKIVEGRLRTGGNALAEITDITSVENYESYVFIMLSSDSVVSSSFTHVLFWYHESLGSKFLELKLKSSF